jgi:hypothetical protein
MPFPIFCRFALAVSFGIAPATAWACGLSAADQQNLIVLAVFNNLECGKPSVKETPRAVEHAKTPIEAVVEYVEIPLDSSGKKEPSDYTDVRNAATVDSDTYANVDSRHYEEILKVSGTPAPKPTPEPKRTPEEEESTEDRTREQGRSRRL